MNNITICKSNEYKKNFTIYTQSNKYTTMGGKYGT